MNSKLTYVAPVILAAVLSLPSFGASFIPPRRLVTVGGQGVSKKGDALPPLRYTYPVHREEWRREGLQMSVYDRPRRNLDIGRADRRMFFRDYVDR